MPTDHYEYLIMPFLLTNSPTVFQKLIGNVLWGMLNQFVFVYLVNIMVFSHNHAQHVCKVLQCLLQCNLLVKAEKCGLHKQRVSFLGFVLHKGSSQMDPQRLKATVKWLQHCTPGTYHVSSVSLVFMLFSLGV